MLNLWAKVLANLKSKVSDQTYNVWFFPIRQTGHDVNSVTLSVPNKFFKDWITDHYMDIIRKTFFETAGGEVLIKFEISDSPARTSADPPSGEMKDNVMDSRLSLPMQGRGGNDKSDKHGTIDWLKNVLSGGKQIPDTRFRELGLSHKYTFDNFVVGPGNRFSHAASLAVSENPAKSYNPLFIYGGVGLGKTHLLKAIGYDVLTRNPKAKIMYLSSEEFTNQLINAIRTKTTKEFRNMYRSVDLLLIDDIQFIAGKEATQEEFFHTFNTLYDAHKQIVLSSDHPPKNIPTLEERLVSRFAWGLITDIQPPDFETRIAILAKKSENESVPVSKEVLFFLADKITANIRELEGALIRVVAYSKLTGKELDADLAKSVLKGMISEERKVNIKNIQEYVAKYFDITVDELKSKRRTHQVAFPRQMAMYLCRKLTDNSLPDIGSHFGGKDHTTVLHAFSKINKEINEKERTRTISEELIGQIKGT